MNETFVAALVRGVILSVVTGLVTWATTASQSGAGSETAILAGVAAAGSAFLARWGGEGWVDSQRAKRNSEG